MKQSFRKIGGKLMLIALLMLILAGSIVASQVRHAMIGSIETIDKSAQTVSVKTAEGTVETIRWTGRTTVRGLKDAAKASDFAGREGSHVVVHYTTKGGKKTANAFEYLGRESPKTAEGTIKILAKGTKTIVVKTGDGAEETFDLSERAVVDTGRSLADAAEFTADKTADGAKVTVHYTDEGGRKIVHLIKRL